MAGDLEKLAVDIERPIGCLSRAVFWILFVIYGAILAVVGWLVYNYVLVPHPTLIPDNAKNAVIVILGVVVLGVMLAAITRDRIRNRIYQRVLRKRNKS